MLRASIAFMICGFGSLSLGCYDRPPPLAGETEAGSSTAGSTTMSQGSTSEDSATTGLPTTGASMTSSTTSSGGPSTGEPGTDTGSTTTGTATGTADTEDASSSSGEDFEACDPLLQSCGDGEGCYDAGSGFGCQVDESGAGGLHGDECLAANECAPGSVCVVAAAVGACDAGVATCCAALCDLSVPECPGISPVCNTWFTPGSAPIGLEDVGVCSAD